jgi:hypothetical protein
MLCSMRMAEHLPRARLLNTWLRDLFRSVEIYSGQSYPKQLQ